MGILLLYKEVNAKPINKLQLDPELEANKFEGDMLLTEDQLRVLTNSPPRIQGRNGLIAVNKRWPDNTVYYKIEGDFGESQG